MRTKKTQLIKRFYAYAYLSYSLSISVSSFPLPVSLFRSHVGKSILIYPVPGRTMVRNIRHVFLFAQSDLYYWPPVRPYVCISSDLLCLIARWTPIAPRSTCSYHKCIVCCFMFRVYHVWKQKTVQRKAFKHLFENSDFYTLHLCVCVWILLEMT